MIAAQNGVDVEDVLEDISGPPLLLEEDVAVEHGEQAVAVCRIPPPLSNDVACGAHDPDGSGKGCRMHGANTDAQFFAHPTRKTTNLFFMRRGVALHAFTASERL